MWPAQACPKPETKMLDYIKYSWTKIPAAKRHLYFYLFLVVFVLVVHSYQSWQEIINKTPTAQAMGPANP
jgi:hypothetical protein